MKNWLLILTLILVGNANEASSQFYIGIGGVYSQPTSNSELTSDRSYGISIQLESRRFCNWWYGLRIDAITYDSIPNSPVGTLYYRETLVISPEIRYNLFNENCYENPFLPYLQLLINLSSMENSDKLNQLGLGLSGGGGIVFPFRFVGYCWSIDLNLLYSAPNFILKDSDREVFRAINGSLTLSIGL